MTIQIDDAGWGSLVGPVLIGICREESPRTQHAFREIPVAYFQCPAFARKLYLQQALACARELVRELRVPFDEPVHVCTGYVLEAVREGLKADGYRVVAGKIGDPLQTLIEQELLDWVTRLGVETDLETLTTKQGLYFWQCLQWAKGGDVNAIGGQPDRILHCKTGWSTFDIWINNPYQQAKVLSRRFKAERRRSRWQR